MVLDLEGGGSLRIRSEETLMKAVMVRGTVSIQGEQWWIPLLPAASSVSINASRDCEATICHQRTAPQSMQQNAPSKPERNIDGKHMQHLSHPVLDVRGAMVLGDSVVRAQERNLDQPEVDEVPISAQPVELVHRVSAYVLGTHFGIRTFARESMACLDASGFPAGNWINWIMDTPIRAAMMAQAMVMKATTPMQTFPRT